MTELGCLDRFFAEKILQKGNIYDEKAALGLGLLMQGAREGNLCLKKEVLGDAIEALGPPIVEEGKTLFPKSPIVHSGGRYYLQKNWVYESYLLQHVKRLMSIPPLPLYNLPLFEKKMSEMGDSLLPLQRQAVRASLKKSLTLICGGPGTGKTYTAARMVNLLFSSLDPALKKKYIVTVAAPTGKAASHLQSALQSQGNSYPDLEIKASTLHRLLKLTPGRSRLFSGSRIDADLVVVDEASMIDIPLMAHLLEAIGDGSKLVLLGDPNQLPPIEAGSLFREMSRLFGIHLDVCMRTDDSQLHRIAEAVKRGDFEEFEKNGRLFEAPLFEPLFTRIDPVVSSNPPDPQKSLEKYNQIRILNAIRQGPQGADLLNREIFAKLQTEEKWWAAPILATVNDPFTEIYNGMSGILIGRGKWVDAAYFPNSSGTLNRLSQPPPYELAFCLSIHKSQGSEFGEVLALFPEGSEHFGREALYTAITRAKKRIEIYAEKTMMEKMIGASSRVESGFAERLENYQSLPKSPSSSSKSKKSFLEGTEFGAKGTGGGAG